MNSPIHLVAVIAGLVLVLHGTTSTWGDQPPNPTGSDQFDNTAGGAGALQNLTTSSNVVSNTGFGKNALTTNSTGSANTAVGAGALLSNSTGAFNTANGYVSLNENTTGGNNTAIGALSLFTNSTGASNTAAGSSALAGNQTGSNNTAAGSSALGGNQTGNNNTAAGFEALLNNTTGNHNSALGHKALRNNTAGLKNTAVGRSALFHSTGSQNIAIGYAAGVALTTGNNDIYLGHPGSGDESLTMRLGSIQNRTFIAGIATASVSNAATVEIDTTTGQLGVPLSSARYKQDIAPMGTRSEKVLQLRPVTFAYRDDAKAMTHYGLIAEEVAAVLPELVTRTPAGDVQTVKYQELIPMLPNELQREHQEVAGLRKELAELRALVAGQLAGQRTIVAGPLLTQSETDEAVR